jgi:hypothetical protein
MLLALRKTAPRGATLWQRFACWVIKVRLVSQYCHGGIVIDGALYHSTSSKGLHRIAPGDWDVERWDLIDVEADEGAALAAFQKHQHAAYDWFSLLAFAGLPARDSERFYCFEWCWLAMTGEAARKRVTPEMLITTSLDDRIARFFRPASA